MSTLSDWIAPIVIVLVAFAAAAGWSALAWRRPAFASRLRISLRAPSIPRLWGVSDEERAFRSLCRRLGLPQTQRDALRSIAAALPGAEPVALLVSRSAFEKAAASHDPSVVAPLRHAVFGASPARRA